MKKLLHLFILASLLLCFGIVQAQNDTIPVKMNTWVDQLHPDKNHVGEADMGITINSDSSREALLKFDISNLSGLVSAASLTMTYDIFTLDNYPFSFGIYGCDTSWADNTVTWNTKPGLTTGNLLKITITVPNNIDYHNIQTFSVDLADYINQRVQKGDKEVAFDLKAIVATDGIRAWVSSNGWGGHGAVLTVTTSNQHVVAQDTWVDQLNPTKNHNGETDMGVTANADSSRETLLKFKINKITQNVGQAYITVHAAQADIANGPLYTNIPDFYVNVFATDTSWTDALVNWNTKPALTDSIARFDVKSSIDYGNGADLNIDITDYMNTLIGSDATEVSFDLKGANTTPTSRIWISDVAWKGAKLTYIYGENNSGSIVQDSWVDQLHPDQNHNGEADMGVTLNADSSRETLLKFDISNLKGIALNANLLLFGEQADSSNNPLYINPLDFYVNVYGIDTSWEESTVTWNNKPLFTDSITQCDFKKWKPYAFIGGGFNVDVTNYINNCVAQGFKKVAFGLKGAENTPLSRVWISDKQWEAAQLNVIQVDPALVATSVQKVISNMKVSIYPNPFNQAANIQFELASRAKTTIEIYDMMGKQVAVIANGYLDAGVYNRTFDGSSLPNGIYIVKFTIGTQASSHKLLLLK
jgi:hypothetical protein